MLPAECAECNGRVVMDPRRSELICEACGLVMAEQLAVEPSTALGDSRRVHDCSFAIRAGEVLGLAGMVGAGRTELARLLFGAAGHKSGDIILEGITRYFHQPREAIAAGVAYLTEDRKIDGLFLDMAVADNIILCTIENDARFGGILDRARGRQRAVAAIRALAIRVASPTVGVGLLSGGNQQKVLLSRLLEAHPKVLILDEPTRGVDIGAKLKFTESSTSWRGPVWPSCLSRRNWRRS